MNERQIIETIAQFATGTTHDDLLQGIGDDCAVIRKDAERVWLLTTDTLVESVHFNRDFHPPALLGRKVVAVNVSDIAAMGGEPLFLLLSLALPKDFAADWLQDFIQGLGEACQAYGCCLIGGDTVSTPQGLSCTVTAIGQAQERAVLYRNGALPGDTIWVSGPLGFAAAGLALFETGLGADQRAFEVLREKHCNPQARVQLGQQLAASGRVHAMMDLSDGLATDLAHICRRSGVGARLSAQALPGLAELAEAASLVGVHPETWALTGGEDYELLFTAAAQDDAMLRHLAKQCGQEIFPVGCITPGEGVTLLRTTATGDQEETAIAYQGFDHFRD